MQLQVQSATQIVADINGHIVKSGAKHYNEWYVGITSDIEQRLFGDHNVPRANHWFIYRRGGSDEVSREAEATMLEKGCQGGGGGGDESSVFVYAYKITVGTKE